MESPFKSYTVTQGIVTKYLAPTTNKDGRIKAKAWAGHVAVSYDHGLCVEENHMAAARMLANKYGWLNSEKRLVLCGAAFSLSDQFYPRYSALDVGAVGGVHLAKNSIETLCVRGLSRGSRAGKKVEDSALWGCNEFAEVAHERERFDGWMLAASAIVAVSLGRVEEPRSGTFISLYILYSILTHPCVLIERA
jgi:hypothetical protein